jgi:hypothetical protein
VLLVLLVLLLLLLQFWLATLLDLWLPRHPQSPMLRASRSLGLPFRHLMHHRRWAPAGLTVENIKSHLISSEEFKRNARFSTPLIKRITSGNGPCFSFAICDHCESPVFLHEILRVAFFSASFPSSCHLHSGNLYGSVSKPCTPGEHQNSW